MAITRRIDAPNHPRWRTPGRRKAAIVGLMESYNLSAADVAELTGKQIHTVYAWRAPDKNDAPPISVLRALMYDLLAGE